MKSNIIKNKIIKLVVVATILTSLISCKVDEGRNILPNGQTPEELLQDQTIYKAPIANMLNNILTVNPAWQSQLQQNLIGDVYSGYQTPPTPFAGDSNNVHYNLIDGWNQFPWTIAYQNIIPNVERIFQTSATYNIEAPQYEGLALVLKVLGMHRVSDIYGPIIYTQFGKNPSGDSFDTQKIAYYAFFTDLDAALVKLNKAIGLGMSIDPKVDQTTFGGDLSKWVKFANSLRLRLALRISNVDPAKAKMEGEKALAHAGGLLTTAGDNLIYYKPNPLRTFSDVWEDIRMGASIESILKGLNDPRMNSYFVPSAKNGQFLGIRQGIDIANFGGKPEYLKYSKINQSVTASIQFMSSAEAQFLIAEAALRGWNTNGVTAKTAYDKGIENSFIQYGVAGSLSTYLTNMSNIPSAYVDPINSDNNALPVSTVTVAWNTADTFDLKMEKIITQKWIAMFPDGQEAWSEVRRTGYPKIFPVKFNKSGGKISTTAFIKRINFPSSEKLTNGSNVSAAVGLLGGPDTGGTALWWDVN